MLSSLCARRLTLIFFVSLVSYCASAQSVKPSTETEKMSRKERKKLRKEVAEKNAQVAKPATSHKLTSHSRQQLSYRESEKKSHYRVSLLVPVFLDELVRGESVTFKGAVPDKAADGLHFYQGAKLAADSLDRAGMKMDLYVYDAGSWQESPDMLLEHRTLDSSDLVIGALEQHDIPALATWARKRKVNFVSALSAYDGSVKDNQYFTMLQPSLKTHCEYMIDDLSGKYEGSKVTFMYRSSSLEEENIALYMLNDVYSEVRFRKLLCDVLPDRERLAEIVDSSRPNVIVVDILEQSFADSLLRLISSTFPNTHFEIYGMPSWFDMASLHGHSYNNLSIHITHSSCFEQGDSLLQHRVEARYRNEFGGPMPEMSLKGYETMLWYGALLQKYGPIFNEEYKDLSGAPFTHFRVKPRWDRNGNLLYLENRQIYMWVYQGGRHTIATR